MDNSNNRYNFIFTIVLIWLPILNIYSSGIVGLGLGDVLLLFVTAILIYHDKGIVVDKTGYWLFIIYLIAVSLILTLFISEYQLSETITKLAKMSLYAFIICQIARKHFLVERGVLLYINTSFVASVYLLLQALLHITLGIYLPINLPFLRLASMEIGSTYYEAMISGYEVFGYRYSGFFMEPAQFCQYTVFAVILLLFLDELHIQIKRKTTKLIIICLGIIISFSAMGYVLVLVVWFIWILKKAKNVQSFLRKIATMIVGITILVFVSLKTGAFTSMQARMMGISGVGVSSGNMRILRGFEIFNQEPFVFKIFGIGAGNFSAFMDHFNIATRYDAYIPLNNEYMSGISTVLVYGGVIGLVLFTIPIIKAIKYNSFMTRTIMIILLLILFSSSSLISAVFTVPMAIVYALIPFFKEKTVLNTKRTDLESKTNFQLYTGSL